MFCHKHGHQATICRECDAEIAIEWKKGYDDRINHRPKVHQATYAYREGYNVAMTKQENEGDSENG